MKARKIIFSPEARADLRKLRSWILDVGGAKTANRYLKRLRAFCEGLELASERGTLREHVRPGLRIVGFEKRVTIAFVVDATTVTVLRVFYAGVDWEKRSFNESTDKHADEKCEL